MKSITELTTGVRNSLVNEPAKDPTDQPRNDRDSSPARYVFLRMHGAYGAQWLDKWRTGLLDADGKDRGVASVMAQWNVSLGGFTRETIASACEAVTDERRRADHKFPPSMPEFVALCRALTPRHAPPVALPDLMQKAEQLEGRERLALIKQTALVDRSRTGPLERLQDLIFEAYRLGGGSIEELTQWQMTR